MDAERVLRDGILFAMAKKRAKPSTWKRVLGGAFYALFCILALGAGVAASMFRESPMLYSAFKYKFGGGKPQDVFTSSTLTLLILGCDEDLSYGGASVLRANARSDMMLVAKLDFDKKRIGGVSIPRDLEVQLPGYSAKKINAYHSIGGPDLAKKAAEEVLGVPIDKVVVLNYDAFQDIVNMVGGVDLYVPKNMKYTDRAAKLYIDFKKGRQHMDGYQAMCFARFRHSDDDFHRMERQRDLMLAIKDGVMRNPGLIAPLSNKAVELLGGGLEGEEMIALADFAKGLPADNIKMSNLPTLPGRGSNLNLDIDKLDQTLRENFLVEDPMAGNKVTSR